ncbi:unnamed protein product [Moneuplotes crassus]|uniref:Uncharacterized protein n=1 Tax=Euplotes crassus TaxID=5936 RepID=A0AAD1X4U2_EUPCR|nr:unnamed protein product [Moneuplotes crassus]
MNLITQKIQFDENLSEDFLSEEVSSCKIRTSEKILANMSRKSLSHKKYMNQLDFSFCAIQDKSTTTGAQSEASPLNRLIEIKESSKKARKMSSFNKACESPDKSDKSQHSSSLKSEISILLKVVGSIRKRDMMQNKESKFKPKTSPMIAQEITMRGIAPAKEY